MEVWDASGTVTTRVEGFKEVGVLSMQVMGWRIGEFETRESMGEACASHAAGNSISFCVLRFALHRDHI